MRTVSALAFLLAVVVPLTTSLPASNNGVTRPPVQARWPILKPRYLNVTEPEDLPDDPTVPVPGKPILVPADGSVLLDERDAPHRKRFKPRRRTKRHQHARQKRDQNGGLVVTIVDVGNDNQPNVIKLSPFNGTAI